MLCCAGYYPNLTLHFKAYGTGLLPASDQDVLLKKIFAVFLKINALLKWVLQLTLNVRRFTKNRHSDGRRRKSDKQVDGNSSLSLYKKKRKKNTQMWRQHK